MQAGMLLCAYWRSVSMCNLREVSHSNTVKPLGRANVTHHALEGPPKASLTLCQERALSRLSCGRFHGQPGLQAALLVDSSTIDPLTAREARPHSSCLCSGAPWLLARRSTEPLPTPYSARLHRWCHTQKDALLWRGARRKTFSRCSLTSWIRHP